MSFSASARTARDPDQPTGRRVRALHQCIEAFQPYGWDGTRYQLARICGVEDGWWSAEQVLQALDVLERTRAPWVAFAQQELREARAHARRRPRTPRPSAGFVDWFAAWAADPEHAELWGVADLGDCPACGHLWALHGRYVCTACLADRSSVALDGACLLPSPLRLPPPSLPRRSRSTAPRPGSLWSRLVQRSR